MQLPRVGVVGRGCGDGVGRWGVGGGGVGGEGVDWIRGEREAEGLVLGVEEEVLLQCQSPAGGGGEGIAAK